MANALPPDLGGFLARLGLAADDLDEVDSLRATNALADATTLALAEVAGPTAARWALDAPAVVALVIRKAARREFENPRGIYQEAQGEHSVGLKDTTGVYLTAAEVAQVRRAEFGRPSTVGSVRIRSAYTPR